MEFKYKTKFVSSATLNKGKWLEAKANNIAFAPLDDLRSLLPSDQEIGDNPDLLYTSFNAAVVNLVNANDHAIATDTALAMSKYFVNKHMNIEHNKYDIVGHIISQGFSSFGENKILKAAELTGSTDPFNISLGTVVYKYVREYVAEMIQESCDEDSDWFQSISASWEIGFNEFDIILGSKKLSDATIISDPEKIKEYSQYLKMEGGSGFLPDGTPVYCLIKGEARPIGCAFTSSPAAAVKGLYVVETPEQEEDPDLASKKKGECSLEKINESVSRVEETTKETQKSYAKIIEICENLQKDIKNNSQIQKNTVNTNMKLKSKEDITPEFLQTAEASREVQDFIVNELQKASQTFEEEKQTLVSAKADIEKQLEEVNKGLANTQEELNNLKLSVAEKEKQEAFDSRMEELSSNFELSDAQTKVIASQIKDLDENAFKSWKENFEVLFAKKQEKQEESKLSESIKEATASTTSATIPNTISPEVNEIEALAKSLRESVEIK